MKVDSCLQIVLVMFYATEIYRIFYDCFLQYALEFQNSPSWETAQPPLFSLLSMVLFVWFTQSVIRKVKSELLLSLCVRIAAFLILFSHILKSMHVNSIDSESVKEDIMENKLVSLKNFSRLVENFVVLLCTLLLVKRIVKEEERERVVVSFSQEKMPIIINYN